MHEQWFPPKRNFLDVVPYHLEIENMVDSNLLGITKYEPFLEHMNPQHNSSNLWVNPSSPT